jgi:hypothetical protein
MALIQDLTAALDLIVIPDLAIAFDLTKPPPPDLAMTPDDLASTDLATVQDMGCVQNNFQCCPVCAVTQHCCVGNPFPKPTCWNGPCPVSRRAYKTDIEYLGQADLERVRDRLLKVRLVENGDAIAPEVKDMDLYSYASMAVATMQVQARQIEELRRELRELKAALAKRNRRP